MKLKYYFINLIKIMIFKIQNLIKILNINNKIFKFNIINNWSFFVKFFFVLISLIFFVFIYFNYNILNWKLILTLILITIFNLYLIYKEYKRSIYYNINRKSYKLPFLVERISKKFAIIENKMWIKKYETHYNLFSLIACIFTIMKIILFKLGIISFYYAVISDVWIMPIVIILLIFIFYSFSKLMHIHYRINKTIKKILKKNGI